MTTVDAIFKAFKGPANVGRAIGKRTEHAVQMRRRGSIPVTYWPALITYAEANTIPGVSYAALVAAHACRSRHAPSAQAGAAA